MSAAYDAITTAMNSIADELRIGQAKEGLPDLLLTGRIELDVAAQRCWFEVLDDGYNVTSWVTADAPELAAHGETLCAAASLEEALMLGQDDEGHVRDYPHTS